MKKIFSFVEEDDEQQNELYPDAEKVVQAEVAEKNKYTHDDVIFAQFAIQLVIICLVTLQTCHTFSFNFYDVQFPLSFIFLLFFGNMYIFGTTKNIDEAMNGNIGACVGIFVYIALHNNPSYIPIFIEVYQALVWIGTFLFMLLWKVDFATIGCLSLMILLLYSCVSYLDVTNILPLKFVITSLHLFYVSICSENKVALVLRQFSFSMLTVMNTMFSMSFHDANCVKPECLVIYRNVTI